MFSVLTRRKTELRTETLNYGTEYTPIHRRHFINTTLSFCPNKAYGARLRDGELNIFESPSITEGFLLI